MKCSKAQKALALLAGGDLEERGEHAVEAHLAECEGCRAFDGELRRSRAWLVSTPAPPLEQAESAAIRSNVWRRIQASDRAGGSDLRTGRPLAVGAAAGVLAALVLAFALFPRVRTAAPAPAPSNAPRATVAALEPERPLAAPLAPERVAESRRPRVGAERAARIASQTVKIEFQTANPDVRIIWLVKAGEATPSAAAGRKQEVS